MTSTKLMLLGILVMLLGFALASAATQFIAFRDLGPDATSNLSYVADALFVVGFVVGVVGLFRERGH